MKFEKIDESIFLKNGKFSRQLFFSFFDSEREITCDDLAEFGAFINSSDCVNIQDTSPLSKYQISFFPCIQGMINMVEQGKILDKRQTNERTILDNILDFLTQMPDTGITNFSKTEIDMVNSFLTQYQTAVNQKKC